MAIKVVRINDRPVVTVKQVMCDTEDEILGLSPKEYAVGSIAYTPGLEYVYHMCPDGEWHLIEGGAFYSPANGVSVVAGGGNAGSGSGCGCEHYEANLSVVLTDDGEGNLDLGLKMEEEDGSDSCNCSAGKLGILFEDGEAGHVSVGFVVTEDGE